jgi:two-component system sensor histidine kinase HydH
MNSNIFCIHPEYQDKLCWILMLSNPEPDTVNQPDPSAIQDDITICYECQQFKTTTERGFGRRSADQAIGLTVIKLLEQLLLKKRNLQHTADELKKSIEQLSLLKNITDALARSDSLEKSLRIILTGASSGDAFGFNRAAVFLVNDNNKMLEGKCAIGPESPEEANRIWEEISKIPLNRLLEEILAGEEFVPCSLEMMISNVRVPISDKENPLIKILNDSKEKVIDIKKDLYPDFNMSWWPRSEKVVAVPLISEGKPLGLIWADNAITGKPVTNELIGSLKSLANACASGLQNAILHQKLYAQLKELERVHELFKSNQAYLVRHERLADIGMLATKVAHEFRVPLVTIGGYARRINKTIGTKNFDRQFVDVIISEVDRLSKITSDILEYSRGTKLNIKECDLNTIIDDSLNQLKDKLETSGIMPEKRFMTRKLTIKADPQRLKQVIFNLVDNAVDAMGKGGKLTIKTSKQKGYVILDIKDTGIGIDRKEFENLFRLFYTTKEKGSGLGLAVSKNIVDDHGGYINVDSRLGEGTIFSVHIPALNIHGNTENDQT